MDPSRRAILASTTLGSAALASACIPDFEPTLNDAAYTMGTAPQVCYAELSSGPGGGLSSSIWGTIHTNAEAEDLPEVIEEAWHRGIKVLFEIYGEIAVSVSTVVGFAADGSKFYVEELLEDSPDDVSLGRFYDHCGLF